MWVWFLILAIVCVAGVVIADALLAARRRQRGYQQALDAWRTSSPSERARIIGRMAEAADDGVRNAQAWYLLGCHHLSEGDYRKAARAFGIAHHADYRFTSAALLTFAALKAAGPAGGDWITLLAATWHEVGRPDPARTPEDARTLACLESTTRDPPLLSPLGRLAWLVSGPEAQARIEQILLQPADPLTVDLVK